MLQRIQTVYLFISAILIVSLFGVSSANIFSTSGELYIYNVKGIYSAIENGGLVYPGWPVALMAAALALLHVVVIFLYKKRQAQMRLTILSILMETGLAAVMYYFISKGSALLNADFNLEVPFVFPVIAAILDYLGWRGIVKDETLIKSLDRIR